jgi:hypothetical protein
MRLLSGFVSLICMSRLVAFAGQNFKLDATSDKGVALNLTLPVENPAAGSTLGALVCASQDLEISEASLWMEHGHGMIAHGGHPGPRVAVRPLDTKCFQINEITFPHGGQWQVKLKFKNGDLGLFEFNVAEGLATSTKVAQGNMGTSGALHFSEDKVTASTQSALFCSNEKSALNEALLWMPDMGHGSSPTSLLPADDNCFEVNNLDFFMTGNWEVRVTLASGEKIAFVVPVKD